MHTLSLKASAFLFTGVALFFAAIFNRAHAQTNDLMIVEYVDWNQGDGFAVEIFNPTAAPISLADYYLKVYNNGNLTASSSTQLSGILAPCATITFGNFSNCNLSINQNVSGVNGDDAVALTKGNTSNFIDMVGLVGGGNPVKVDNVPNALKWNRLVRNAGNTTRYTSTSGTAANSWPGTSNVNVTGWTVNSVSCISQGHSLSGLTLNIGADTTICAGSVLTLDAGVQGATYLWSTGATTRTIQVNTAGTYSVQVSNACASGSASRTITINPGLQVNAGNDIVLACKTQAAIPINGMLSAANATVTWSGGKGSFSNAASLATFYTPSPQDHYQIKLRLTATSACGQQTDEVIIFNGDSTLIPAALTFSPPNPAIGDTVTFTLQTAANANGLTGNYDFGDGSPVLKQVFRARHVYSKTGLFDVRVTTNMPGNCVSDTLRTTIRIAERPLPVAILIPNVFTPDNDGKNDTYKVQLPPTKTYALQIYNRWGMPVFSSTDRENNWDGRNVTAGVYYIHLKAVLDTGELIDKKLPLTIIK